MTDEPTLSLGVFGRSAKENELRLPIHPRHFDRIDADPHNLAIVRAILSLSQALSLKSTAEGIETDEQLRIVRAEGCTHVQGFLLGRPVPADEALRMARKTAA